MTALRNTEQGNARQSAALQRNIEKIRLQLSEEIAKHSSAAAQLKEKNSRLESLSAELRREKSAAAILAREMETMRNSANSAAAELKKLVSETTELRRRLKFREGEDFKNLTAARSDRDRLQKELHKCEEQLAALRAEHKMTTDKQSALDRSLKELQTENRKLHAERISYEDRFKALSGASANAQELARQYSELKVNFAALQKENRQNKLAADAAKPREAELARIKLRLAELDGLKQQLRREQSFNEQLNAVKSRLEKELRQLRPMGTENAALKAQLSDHAMLKSEVERLRKLSAELAGAQKLSGQIAELKMQLAQTQPLADEANKQGKMLNIGVCNRYHKSVEKLEQLNREGKFGNLYHVYCSFRSFRSIPGLGGAFTNKKESGGGVLIDWGVHFFDLILYILGGAKLKTATCDAYCEMAKDMKEYKYRGMWAQDTSDIENGTNDVDDFISGYIRTDKASISFNGAWAQNIDKEEMFIDFLGDKAGARLTYGGKFELYDAKTLETIAPEYDIPNMFVCEDRAFINSITTGEKTRSHIDNVLESAKLLDCLYKSSEARKEVLE